jgi:hypothetical protein
LSGTTVGGPDPQRVGHEQQQLREIPGPYGRKTVLPRPEDQPEQLGEGPHLKREVSGCVKWRDQVRIMDRI